MVFGVGFGAVVVVAVAGLAVVVVVVLAGVVFGAVVVVGVVVAAGVVVMLPVEAVPLVAGVDEVGAGIVPAAGSGPGKGWFVTLAMYSFSPSSLPS